MQILRGFYKANCILKFTDVRKNSLYFVLRKLELIQKLMFGLSEKVELSLPRILPKVQQSLELQKPKSIKE